jgi:vacuolar-type H+-ATPase subunit F/Vma7
MSRAAAIGEAFRVAGYALAGVEVRPVESPVAALNAWRTLDGDTQLVLLTPAAAAALDGLLTETAGRIWVVLPE